jgi:hypothetical protein
MGASKNISVSILPADVLINSERQSGLSAYLNLNLPPAATSTSAMF